MVFVGVDAGGTVIKAAIYDAVGRALGMSSARVESSSPVEGMAEKDMDALWDAAARSIQGALGDWGGLPADVEAVCFVGHGDGLYLVDAQRRPVRPAIQATDRRARPYVEAWRRSELALEVLEISGQLPFAGSAASLWAWLSEYEPASVSATRYLLYCKDWLRYRLTGAIGTDPTDASASFVDVGSGGYDGRLAMLLGLEGVLERLPDIHDSTFVTAEVSVAGARATGLEVGTPVVCGAHDVHASALAMDALEPGALSLLAGTFSVNQVPLERVTVSPQWQCRRSLTEGKWMAMSTSPVSAANLDWILAVVGASGPKAYDRLADLALQGLGCWERPYFLPFLYGAPFEMKAAAGMYGLQAHHRAEHLVSSVFEALCFNHRMHAQFFLDAGLVLERPVRISGGASRSSVWCQLMSDVLGCVVEVSADQELGTRGAAILAAAGVGRNADLAAVAGTQWRTERRYEPDPAAHERFSQRYVTYLRILHESESFSV